jgi:hypothetical protein
VGAKVCVVQKKWKSGLKRGGGIVSSDSVGFGSSYL